MSAYRDKLRQPLSNFRRWISDLGNSPLTPSLLTGGRPDPDNQQQEQEQEQEQQQSGPSQLLQAGPPIITLCDTSSSSSQQACPAMAERQPETKGELENIMQSLDSMKVCSEISQTQMKEFREAFRFFDKDGDGCITTEELGIVMRSLGQFASEEELKEMLKEVDINGDGLFSFDEFVEIVSNYSGPTSGNTDEEQELRDAFRIFDKHSRGFISASDLRAVLHCLGEDLSEDEIEDMIKEVDVDGDGRIDFDEFVRALGEPDEGEEDERGTSFEITD